MILDSAIDGFTTEIKRRHAWSKKQGLDVTQSSVSSLRELFMGAVAEGDMVGVGLLAALIHKAENE